MTRTELATLRVARLTRATPARGYARHRKPPFWRGPRLGRLLATLALAWVVALVR